LLVLGLAPHHLMQMQILTGPIHTEILIFRAGVNTKTLVEGTRLDMVGITQMCIWTSEHSQAELLTMTGAYSLAGAMLPQLGRRSHYYMQRRLVLVGMSHQ